MTSLSTFSFTFPVLILSLLQLSLVHAKATAQEEKENYHKTLCTHPKVAKEFNGMWFIVNSPEKGWYMEYSNAVTRTHVAESLLGRPVKKEDDLSKVCGRVTILHGDPKSDGTYYGYNNTKTAKWECVTDEKDPGVYLCTYHSQQLKNNQKYHFKLYPKFTDNNKLVIFVVCFANGDTGWVTMSTDPLTVKEHETHQNTALTQVTSVGFKKEDIVTLFCPKGCPH